jgi:hypothetical protein
MYMGAEVFEAYDPRRAAALHEYYEYARDSIGVSFSVGARDSVRIGDDPHGMTQLV